MLHRLRHAWRDYRHQVRTYRTLVGPVLEVEKVRFTDLGYEYLRDHYLDEPDELDRVDADGRTWHIEYDVVYDPDGADPTERPPLRVSLTSSGWDSFGRVISRGIYFVVE